MLVNGKEIKVTAELIQVKNGDCKSHEYKIQCKYTSVFTPPTHPFSMKIGTVMIRCMCLGSNQLHLRRSELLVQEYDLY